MKTYPFYTAITTCHNLYGVSLDPVEFEELGWIAWETIGNKDCRIYKFEACLNGEDSLTLPINCERVDAVSNNIPEAQDTDNVQRFNYIPSWMESYVEGRTNYNRSPLYVKGKLLKGWKERNGELLFDTPIKGDVTILYKGILADETGLPFLNQKELEAIACYCAMTYHLKRGMMMRDQLSLNIGTGLEAKWHRLMLRARTPIKLSQNDLNTILDARSSWDRHKYNKSTKIFK